MIQLDTQVALWLTLERSRLSKTAREALSEASSKGEGIALASTSLWEIAMLTGKRDFRLPNDLSAYLRYMESVFVVLPITGAIAAKSIGFSSKYPKDPSDRIIGATALVHGLKLLTADKLIRKSGEVPTIW